MKVIKITPSKLKGEITLPSSKSFCHRTIIASALSKDVSTIFNTNISKDVETTCAALKVLGAKIEVFENTLKVKGFSTKTTTNNCTVDFGDSITSLRLLFPMLLLNCKEMTIRAKSSVLKRALEPYFEMFRNCAIEWEYTEGNDEIKLKGQLKKGEYKFKGDVSSQVISGFLYALPLLNGDSVLEVVDKSESIGYIDLTIDVLNCFGVKIKREGEKKFYIKGNQEYKSTEYVLEGDASYGSFYLCGGLLGEEVKCILLNPDSMQPDIKILDIIKEMNGKIEIRDSIKTFQSELKGITLDVSECIDLAPLIAVLGSFAEGTTLLTNASRLRYKECDRLKAITTELSKIGADIYEGEDYLKIVGKPYLEGGEVDSWEDYRIAMSLAVASIRCKNDIIINRAEYVHNNYPQFFKDFQKLGGKISERNVD
ncbi:MAG: 3-phosphoshikimate 1-carboxyvinyltransferase [Oscillospiraceae bacterium]|nr:3-phosphoshikimate 1-carboxyvinyltransferase [Oscillospiraceae bacterium]